MPYATIDKPSKYFNTVLYTGDGASPKSITGVGFKPDFVWSKSRSTAENHNLYDAVRGGTQGLRSNLTNAETSSNIYGYVSTFDSDGVTYISGGTNNDLNNGSGVTFVNWNWLGANTTVSNTSGSITSTVSANTTSGFSIVSYTGTGANATVGHGLGVAPKMMIVKNRSASAHWQVYHTSTGNTASSQLSGTGTPDTASTYWNNTSPTSTLFSIGTGTPTNGSGNNIIAYCFAEVKGYSKFGSYTGNGSTDGTFVYTGFKPKYFAWKVTQSTGNSQNWYVLDTTTSPYNGINNRLHQNTTATEANMGALVDILSNGIKFRTSDTDINGSYNYIYMAFAENPFVSSKGIACTAR